MGKSLTGLASQQDEVGFVLSLREAFAHFSRRNTRSTDRYRYVSGDGSARALKDNGTISTGRISPIFQQAKKG